MKKIAFALLLLGSVVAYGQTYRNTRQANNDTDPANSRSVEQLEHAVLLKKMRSIENKLTILRQTVESQKTDIKTLKSRIRDLEIAAETQATLSDGIPALAQVVADQWTWVQTWIGQAEKVFSWYDTRLTKADEAIQSEITYRNKLVPGDDFLWKRQLAIARHEHGLLAADHYTIGFNLSRRGKSIRIRPRHGAGTVPAEPNPFPPPVVN